jgi:two-component system response regulator HydG
VTGKSRIAVIDDDPEIQDLVKAHFRQKGYEVHAFLQAEDFMKPHGNSDWDAILLDLHLPGLSGVELTPAIKEKAPNSPIIFITSTRSAATAVEALEKGASDYIVKPFHFPQLQLSVERAIYWQKLRGGSDHISPQMKDRQPFRGIIGQSPKFLATLDIARKVSASTSNIFIYGESGTGKEVLARYIHTQSRRNKGPFVPINCSAIPESLLESELFGHAKGAFTGAHERKSGLFEEAEDGTLFLDEIGDLSAPLQAKLLRVLQEKKIKRVGENQYRAINCRIISATHKNLTQEVSEGRFREDLFFRLNVIPIGIPPLRERPEDILILAEAFLRRFASDNDSPAERMSKEALKFLLENPWRGNVRELENTIERATVLATSHEINVEDLKPLAGSSLDTGYTCGPQDTRQAFNLPIGTGLPHLEEVVNSYIRFAVEKNGGARDKTAHEIGIDRKTLYKRLKIVESLSPFSGRSG